MSLARSAWACLVCLAAAGPAPAADRLYSYQDEDGHWVYTDRQPDGVADVHSEPLQPPVERPRIRVMRADDADGAWLVVDNGFAAPVEVEIELREADNAAGEEADRVRLVIAAATRLNALRVVPVDPALPYAFGYQYRYVIGRPGVEHAPREPYRAPFAAARQFAVVQAAPGGYTHTDAGSLYAVDIALPEGTAVFAARGGVIVDVSAGHFRGGVHVDAREANYLRILHDDGSFAIYAHLKWDSIRVRPGERVRRGEYIADSGNTGFSSGPHLHFDVQVNAGLALVSVPFQFDDGRGGGLTPREGDLLTAY